MSISQDFVPSKGNWALFFLAAFLVFINFFVSLTVLPQYVLDIGGTEFQSGLQSSLFFLAAILLRFYFGPLADKKGRKPLLLLGAFVFATSPLLFIIFESLTGLLLARIYQSIGLATFLASGSSLVADMSPPEKRGTYMGAYRLVMTLSILVGPSIAVSIIGSFGYRVWFMTSFLIGVLSVIFMSLVKAPQIPAGKFNSLDGYMGVLRNRKTWPVIIGLVLTAVLFGSLLTFAVMYISEVVPVANPGIYFVYFGLGGIVANLWGGRLIDRLGAPLVVWPALISMGLGSIALSFTSIFSGFIIISSLLTGVGYAASLLALIAWLVESVEDRFRTTALSIQESTLDGSIAIAALVFGALGSWLGFSMVFALTGLFVLFPAILLNLNYIKKKRQ